MILSFQNSMLFRGKTLKSSWNYQKPIKKQVNSKACNGRLFPGDMIRSSKKIYSELSSGENTFKAKPE